MLDHQHEGVSAPGLSPPTSDEAPRLAGAEGFKGHGTADSRDCAVPTSDRKAWATVQARAALAGCRADLVNVRSVDFRAAASATDSPLRFVPQRGESLALRHIRGLWWPAGSVRGIGVFCVRWVTNSGAHFFAPLHDFAPADQLHLVAACRAVDREQGYPGAPAAWRGGR